MTIAQLQRMYNDGLGLRLLPRGTVYGSPVSSEYVAEEPDMLAFNAGVALEPYSLARLIASEGYSGSKRYEGAAASVAICQIVMNEARRRGWSVTKRLTFHTAGDIRDGKYGRQKGRFAATIKDPHAWHKRVAIACWNSQLADISRGAHKFFDPKVQDGGRQAGESLRRDAIGVIREWIVGDGNEFVPIVGVSNYNLMAFRKSRLPKSARMDNYDQAARIIDLGRAGANTVPEGDPDSYTGGNLKMAITLETGLAALRKVFAKS